jgi:hypothetical protein
VFRPSKEELVTVEINLEEDMKNPVYVYLKLTNFYQNHKDMMRSMDRK